MAAKSTRGDSPRIRTPAAQAKHANRRAPASGDSSPTVVGVRISHPDRLIYPDLGTSKIELARYYERIADWIVPHVAGRPLTLVHCPAGIAAPCSFLKHARARGPSALRRVTIQEKTKVGEYLVADSIEAVVSLAQMGIVERSGRTASTSPLAVSACGYMRNGNGARVEPGSTNVTAAS